MDRDRVLSRGKITSYDKRRGYGFIQPDHGSSRELFVVYRKSQRDPNSVFDVGDRVLFTIKEVSIGSIAADVHHEMEHFELHPEHKEGVIGTLDSKQSILLSDGRRASLHTDYLNKEVRSLSVGDHVQCNIVATEQGLLAIDIASIASYETGRSRTVAVPSPTAHDLLSKAVLARDRHDYAEARRLYTQGLRENASVQLVLSYAAMEKSLNRKSEAMQIYEQGIREFPTMSKLREDAGTLAASIGRPDTAIQLLKSALELCRQTTQGGEKGVLLALARVYYHQRDDENALKQSLDYYRSAQKAQSKKRSTSLSPSDHLAMTLAVIRLTHHRGNLAYKFLVSCGFRVVRANLHYANLGADLIIRVEQPELSESYGISGNVLVRCVFKPEFTNNDMLDLDRTVASDISDDLISDQLALLVLASVPNGLQRALFRRIENPRNQEPTVVPLPQEIIEKEESGFDALNNVLGRWLYRRDLFKLNMPVVGRKFFGRERPLSELRDAIMYGTPVGIFGLRKVGKTSLLQETRRRANEAGSIAAYVDLQTMPPDVDHDRWLYWKIADLLHSEFARQSPKSLKMEWRLGGKYEDVEELPTGFPVATCFASDLSRLLRTIGDLDVKPQPKVILMLDEIEQLLSFGFVESEMPDTASNMSGPRGRPSMRSTILRLLGYLRGVTQESNGVFVLMITGANPAISEISQFRLEDRPFDIRDNPVFNFFNEIYLPLLEFKECTLMIRELGRNMGLRFSEEACAFVYQMTGGHPFVTRQLCSFVSDRYPKIRPLVITKEMVAAILDMYMQFSGRDFEEIMDRLRRDYPDEREICVKLAQQGRPMTLKELDPSGTVALKLRHLVGYQIVSVESDRVSLTMELLQKWMSR